MSLTAASGEGGVIEIKAKIGKLSMGTKSPERQSEVRQGHWKLSTRDTEGLADLWSPFL